MEENYFAVEHHPVAVTVNLGEKSSLKTLLLSRNDYGQVVHTRVPVSPHGIIC